MIKPLYDTGNIQLYNGDALEVCAQMGGLSVDVTVTDYPYNISQTSNGLKGKELNFGTWDAFTPGQLRRVTKEIIRVTKHCSYTFCSDEQVSLILRIYRAAGWHVRQLTWYKPNSYSMNVDLLYKWATENAVFARRPLAPFYAYNKDNFFSYDAPPGNARENPTQKPEQLITDWLCDSTVENDLVFDPFMGSGTTIKCAQALRLRAIGVDVRLNQCEATIKRIAQHGLFTEVHQ